MLSTTPMHKNEVLQKIKDLSPGYRPYIQIKTIAQQLAKPIDVVNSTIQDLADRGLVTLLNEKVRLKNMDAKC